MNRQHNNTLSRRDFIRLAAVGAAGTALAACAPAAGPEAGSESAAVAAEGTEVNITIAGWVDTAWQVTERAAEYNQALEGMQINIIPSPDGWETKALSQIAEGTPTWDGRLTHHPFRIAVQWLAQGLIMPIEEFMATSSVIDVDEFWADAIAPEKIKFDCSVNGKVVGVPLGIDTCCQAFNADLMREAGLPSTREEFMAERSWANIQDWAETLREKYQGDNVWGISTWNVYRQSLGAIFQSITDDLYYAEEGLIRFDSEEMQQALTIQSQWSWSGVAPVPAWGQPNEAGDIFPGGRGALWQGQVGVVGAAQRVQGVETIPYAMPVLVEGGTGGNQWYTTCGYVLNKAQYPQEVVDFYLTLFGPQNDTNADLTLKFNWFPVFASQWEKQ
ncbi:MAG: twin-arginine translocation signal domain-containing protein, partial [Caldilineaceae bacterium]|nr:twin-arginine translocation signal domain-containing protein [Caldilineaceae bacterium]